MCSIENDINLLQFDTVNIRNENGPQPVCAVDIEQRVYMHSNYIICTFLH